MKIIVGLDDSKQIHAASCVFDNNFKDVGKDVADMLQSKLNVMTIYAKSVTIGKYLDDTKYSLSEFKE